MFVAISRNVDVEEGDVATSCGLDANLNGCHCVKNAP